MATIPSNLNFPTKRQVAENAILDLFNKQVYLGNQFVSGGDTISVTSSETNLLSISNPSTSTVSLFINTLLLHAVGSGDVITFRVYSQPTVISSGTPATPINCRPANANVSVASVVVGPSVSTMGTRIQTIVSGFNAAGSIAAPMYILDPGQSILITGQGVATATAICETVHYEI